MVRKLWFKLTAVCVAGALPPPIMAIESLQEIDSQEGTIIVYQPQSENLADNVLSRQAAMSLELKGKSEPVVVAFWFTAKLDTDTDAAIGRSLAMGCRCIAAAGTIRRTGEPGTSHGPPRGALTLATTHGRVGTLG